VNGRESETEKLRVGIRVSVKGRVQFNGLFNIFFGSDFISESTKSLFDALSQKKNLQSLNMSMNKLGDDRVVFVANLLKTNKTLTALDIRSNVIG
jgi:hypothetical protein